MSVEFKAQEEKRQVAQMVTYWNQPSSQRSLGGSGAGSLSSLVVGNVFIWNNYLLSVTRITKKKKKIAKAHGLYRIAKCCRVTILEYHSVHLTPLQSTLTIASWLCKFFRYKMTQLCLLNPGSHHCNLHALSPTNWAIHFSFHNAALT